MESLVHHWAPHTYNRTIVELKQSIELGKTNRFSSYNRTIVELKLINHIRKLPIIILQSYHSGIETPLKNSEDR